MKTILIGELGINANGDIDLAKKLINVCHSAGVQFVKFQKRDIDSVYTQEELGLYRESPWGKTFRQQKEGLEFGQSEYEEIARYCHDEVHMQWFASAWDKKSVIFLKQFNPPFIKVPSALMTDLDFLIFVKNNMIHTPVILSTGMCTQHEVAAAVNVFPMERIYAILACTSTYPSKPEEQNLNYITELKKEYHWTKIGFSNHSPGITFMLSAVTLGAEVIEFHITLDRSLLGSDQSSSIEPEGVFRLVKHISNIELSLGTGIKKVFDSEIPIIKKLRKAA